MSLIIAVPFRPKCRSGKACGPELTKVEVTGPTTATTTVVPPPSIMPVKYSATITLEDGRVYTFEVKPNSQGEGIMKLVNLEPCTNYALSVQAVLPDGTKSPAVNTSFSTPPK